MTDIAPLLLASGPVGSYAQAKDTRDFADELRALDQQSDQRRQTLNQARQGSRADGASATEESATASADHSDGPLTPYGNIDVPLGAPYSGLDGGLAGSTSSLVLQARIFGFHLHAAAYLSEYLTGATGAPDRSPDTGGGAVPGAYALTDTDIEPMGAVPMSPTEHGKDGGTPNDALSSAALQFESAHGPAITTYEASEEALPIDTSLEPQTNWTERSLRFHKLPGGRHVVWLRDYALSTQDATDVTRAVIDEARARGITLQTIMLNGHVMWSLDDTR